MPGSSPGMTSARLHLLLDRALHRVDRTLVAAIHGPLLDALGAHEFRRRQDTHVLAHGRLADAELFGDQETADAVFDQIAIDLLAEMLPRLAQPFQDLQPPLIGERA